jgi:Putative prokaryotic signal transducing protein
MPGDPPPPKPPAEPLPADGEFELRPLITIRKFRDLPEALLAKGGLESAGIEAVLTDDNMVRMDWFWSNLMGGIKLSVDQEDAEVANSILDQPIPEDFRVAGIGEYEQPHCPKCQSLDINFQELDRPVAFVSAYFNVPLPVQRRAWRCHSCYAQWEDVTDGEADESKS